MRSLVSCWNWESNEGMESSGSGVEMGVEMEVLMSISFRACWIFLSFWNSSWFMYAVN